ncbi:MAG: helix-hairpin-helix domain-containing protein [Candidatus Methanofastidiosa archaeon]|nr:helix-hairpin-helix domain-containing protein [Candidatus Methanofastidiosa archaeon]
MERMERMIALARQGRFDSEGPAPSVRPDIEKVYALGEATKHDICVSTASPRSVSGIDRIGNVCAGGICHAYAHDGRCVSMFKTLYTNACTHECAYCSNASCSSGGAVYSYTPHELASLFMDLYRGNYVEGLFLSSGVGADEYETMASMVETAEMLRTAYRFQGYVHLKILPGADRDHIRRAMSVSDRVSVNIEVPSSSRLSEICATKDFKTDILRRQRYIQRFVSKEGAPAGQTTQLVVGGAGETDVEIFKATVREYHKFGLKRVYYSAFTPVPGTILESQCMQPAWREHRLYQMDWLYRIYHYSSCELMSAFDCSDHLANTDPKRAIAQASGLSPVDPNIASYDELLRVPGIGPVSARRILAARTRGSIRSRKELAAMGVVMCRASPYLSLGGWHDSLLARWMA